MKRPNPPNLRHFLLFSRRSCCVTCMPFRKPELFSSVVHYGRVEFRQAVGRACKRLLDMGRLVFLRGNGFTADGLYTYCELEDSLENGLLLARRTKM
jgi:hypothetical protein